MGVNRSFAITFTSAVFGLIAAGQVQAQDYYEFRFAFGTVCT